MGLPRGILVSVETIDRDGENQGFKELVVTLEEDVLDIRLDEEDGTIAMVDLYEIEEAIKVLKRWRRERQRQ